MGNNIPVTRRRPNFAAMPYELVDDETISAQAKTVYVILDRFADYETGATFVGKARIARMCGYSKPDSVDRYLNELRDKGWITWSRRWRKNTGKKRVDGRFVYEYSYSSGPGFEPTTSLYIVNDRVALPELSGEGIPPTAGIGTPPTAGGPIPPTAGTNENQVNENQGKGGGTEVEVTGAASPESPSPESPPPPPPADAGATPDTWCTSEHPRCREHAHIPEGDKVPSCPQCGNVRQWFKDQAAMVGDAKRRAIEDCPACDNHGFIETTDTAGRPVAAVCDHEGPPQPVAGPEVHRPVSDAATRRRMIEGLRRGSC